MNGQFKKTYYASTALLILLGILLIVLPGLARKIASIALGCGLMLYGIVSLISSWKSDRLGLYGGAARALAVLLVGILMIKWNDHIALIIMTLIGAAIAAGGFIKLQLSLMLKDAALPAWKRDAIGAAVFMAIGIFLMFDPFAGEKAMIIITGVLMVLSGLSNLWIAHEVNKTIVGNF